MSDQLAIPLKEFDQEMAATRRVLERVPSDKGNWKPHQKSFSLAHLAQLVSWMPGWIDQTLREPHIDLSKGSGYSNQNTETLVQGFDKNVAAARTALSQIAGKALDEQWHLKHGEHVLMTMPRGEVVRQHMSHLAHHRGQLTVYLRLLDVPVPSIYGPTADEKWG
ncbi:MAG TPA: DinB family protein [Longimicrobiales bacterium]